MILDPELLVADEPISMLDMSVRAKILQLMLDLKDELGLTYVYITHDLATAKFFCDRVAIMYLGRIVEIGPTEEIFADPKHPYTKALLKAIPEPDPDAHGAARPAPGGDPGRREPAARLLVPPALPRGRRRSAAGSPATSRRCSRSTGPAGTPSVYEREQGLVGKLERLDEPAKSVTIGTGGTAAEVRRMLDSIRAERPGRAAVAGRLRHQRGRATG